jgi:hypothetical protein
MLKENGRNAGVRRKDHGKLMACERKTRRWTWVCWTLTVGSWLSGCARHDEAASVPPSWQPPPETVAHPPGLPAIGKWMLDARYEPAHWLGELHRGKSLREPINLIVVDTVAQSPEEARKHLIQNFALAGYPIREGHSAGYRAYVDGVVHGQIPEGREQAFSDEPAEMRNNHGRMFGLHPYRGGWLFVGAFSRESVDPLDKVRHRYVSFNQARDDLSQRLDSKTDYKIKGFPSLDNALVDDPIVTTGDHDGIAVLLTRSGL